MKIIEDLGQILVVLHTLLVIIEMTPRLNKQSASLLYHSGVPFFLKNNHFKLNHYVMSFYLFGLGCIGAINWNHI